MLTTFFFIYFIVKILFRLSGLYLLALYIFKGATLTVEEGKQPHITRKIIISIFYLYFAKRYVNEVFMQ